MMRVVLQKSYRVSRYGPISGPGQVVEIDDAKAERLLALGVFALPVDVAAEAESDGGVGSVPADDVPDDVVEEPADDVGGGIPKPKPTEKVDAQRAYLEAAGVDPKGLTRAQMIKVIKDM